MEFFLHDTGKSSLFQGRWQLEQILVDRESQPFAVLNRDAKKTICDTHCQSKLYIYIDFRMSILELKIKTLHLHHQDPLQAKLHIPMARHFVRFSPQWRTTRWWTNSWPNIVRPRPWPQAWPLGDISCCWWFWGLMWLNGKSHIIDTVIYG